ncbi:HNH endonuclease family protein [Streptomyces sp. NPDC097619]|uniref:HNH endonuclease family protein n=1 Tax=Streptomyces sp. NPDC097619 TaxID=3157228 RepID=UPI0033237A87
MRGTRVSAVLVTVLLAAAGAAGCGPQRSSDTVGDARPSAPASAPPAGGGTASSVPDPSDGPSSTAPSAAPGAPGARTLPGLSAPAEARTQLAALPVAERHSMAGYSRARFKHWAGQGESCDTREIVLQREGTEVKRDEDCRAVSGNWVSVYDGQTVTDAARLDIDHMVPLANAWRSGADTWTDARRKEFANDLARPQLLAVTASTNRAKGDQGPDEWKPPARSYWCTYATAWTNVKSHYGLAVTAPEKTTLTEMLAGCAAS